MYQIFGKINNPFKVPIESDNLEINLNIRNVMNQVDIVFLPDDMIYGNDLFYENTTLDQGRKKDVEFGNSYWVYNGLDRHNNKLIKRGVDQLENKHYVVAQMIVDEGRDWKAPYDTRTKIKFKNFTNFEKGIGELPILKYIDKQIKNIGGHDKYDLWENIENSITLHWLYMHRDQLVDYIREVIV
jgi:hypothetical protein